MISYALPWAMLIVAVVCLSCIAEPTQELKLNCLVVNYSDFDAVYFYADPKPVGLVEWEIWSGENLIKQGSHKGRGSYAVFAFKPTTLKFVARVNGVEKTITQPVF